MIDQHVHSNISHDGISTYKEHMEQAKRIGVDEITFTEHFDDYTGIDTNLKTLDINKYKEAYLKSKDDEYVKTNFGIEIGLRPKSHKVICDMVKDNKFDFIIGSSHITCDKDMAYDKSFFEGLTPHQAIQNYLSEVFENIQIYNDEFDVYGHLDYVIRYVIKYYRNVMTKVDYIEFKELIDAILQRLVMKDKGLEINTSGLRYNLESAHPNLEILKRFKELGGKIITVGSDAHKASDLASHFDVAESMLRDAGFDELAVYHDRQPEFIKIRKK
jgi:histidinol-phosphatase (PHP family)